MDDETLENPLLYIPRNFKVLSKAGSSGAGHLAPMELWPAQKYYIENRGTRNICLKNRQQGFSTGVLADSAYALFTLPYQQQTIITHDQDTSEFLLMTIGRFYRHLPWNEGKPNDKMEPKRDWKSGSRMRFPNIDSYIYIDSAQSDSIGIGRGLTRAHLSELAKWPANRARQLFTDISQTVPEKGVLTIESTPKGRMGIFPELCHAAKAGEINYKYFFFPWWWDITCRRQVIEKLEFTQEEKQLIEYVKRQDNLDLTPEHIAFRREKIAELKDLFYQEYPENDTDCWLSSDINVFDGLAIRDYLMECWDGKREGIWTIWKGPIGGEKYVIGADVGSGAVKGDWSVASVLHVKRNEYVARIRGRIPPDFFAEELLKLGAKYNNAEIAVERINHGHAVLKVLLERDYPNIYHYEEYDRITKQWATLQPGWKTSVTSKPIMISGLSAAIRARDLLLWSNNFCDEASSYMWDGPIGNKTRCGPGASDDELDAVMIALQVREGIPITEPRGEQRAISYANL